MSSKNTSERKREKRKNCYKLFLWLPRGHIYVPPIPWTTSATTPTTLFKTKKVFCPNLTFHDMYTKFSETNANTKRDIFWV